ncbi:MAG: hypothetical protein JSU94_05240 [Phycisphaerales bacterium]|nr:MAG: hypothetical protein JSU94_05240 [Phycisphaerales bacterium]
MSNPNRRSLQNNHQSSAGPSRRELLKALGALPLATIAARGVAGPAARAAATALPQIKFGRYSLSRLICGANPFNGGSHLSRFVNRQMKEYYTQEQVLKTLTHCFRVGINCWQAGSDRYKLYRRLVESGVKMHYISINSDPADIAPLTEAGAIGIAHHGEVTDGLFKSGRLDEAHDFLKRVRDAGLMVGLSTHMPDVVDAVESKGWDIDYYMTCVYERHRSADELKRLLGRVPLPVGEVYLAEDPPRMFKAMQQTRRPCLAFKILAAGRLSERKQWVENAFRQTFESIKPNDAVIIGIYDKYSDQPGEDAQFTRRFTKT